MLSLTDILKTLQPYVIGFIFGVITLFVTGFSKEFFGERERKAKHKREVARHLLNICNEASTVNFRQPPKDIGKINATLTDLEGINTEIEKIANSFVSSWQIIYSLVRPGMSSDERKHLVELLDEIEIKRKELVNWANKLRN